MDSLGNRLKQRREVLGLTQEQLAKRLGYKSKTTINKIESGTNDITRRKIKTFAQTLNVSEAWLMGYDVPMNSTLSPNEAWNIDAEKFSDELYHFQINQEAFLHQLKVLGWTCEHAINNTEPDDLNQEFYYVFKKEGYSFSVSWDDYNSFIQDSETFFNTRLEKLYEKSKIHLFPTKNKAYLEPQAAHERTDIEVTDEMRKHDDDIMDNDDFWK